jgi:putative zinc finger protein
MVRRARETGGPLMLSCREASQLLSDRLDRPLRPWERFALRIHLGICSGCGRADRQLQFIRKAMAELVRRGGEKRPGQR